MKLNKKTFSLHYSVQSLFDAFTFSLPGLVVRVDRVVQEPQGLRGVRDLR